MITAELLLPVTIVGYIVAIVAAAAATVYRHRGARRVASWLFLTTWLLHLGAVVHEGVTGSHFPLTNVPEYLLLLGWIILGLHLWLWFVLRLDTAGLVLPPIAAAMSFIALQLLVRPEHKHSIALPDGWFLFHTTVSTLGMAILCVAFTMSVLFLVQDRALKRKKTLRLLERLPPLQRADQIGFRALTLGFVLLTLGIGTGVVVNQEVYQRLVVLGPKQIFPLLAWIVFAAILLARPFLGLRGRKAAYMTITGFALGLLTVVGMTL